MYKLTLINVIGTFSLAIVLANSPVGVSLAAPAVAAIVNASAIDVAPLLGMNRSQLATLYPALTGRELDRLMFRIGDTLSMAQIH